jgi:hypothetical protein
MTAKDGMMTKEGTMTKEEKNMDEKAKETRKPRDPNAPAIKRPREGTWTRISKQIPIPGCFKTDGTAVMSDLSMWRVEYSGEIIEVPANRAGQKKITEWKKAIKARAGERMKILKIKKMIQTLSRFETATPEIKHALECAIGALEEE